MFNRYKKDNRSFLEKLTGVTVNEMPEFTTTQYVPEQNPARRTAPLVREQVERPVEEDDDNDSGEGELAVDVYETLDDIIIHTMIAGVTPENLSISITPEVVKISGTREFSKDLTREEFHFKELYWGSFSRTINLPKEIEPELAEAIEKHGLLIIRLPKVDKLKTHKVKVKSI